MNIKQGMMKGPLVFTQKIKKNEIAILTF